jgi:hypothetical protein
MKAAIKKIVPNTLIPGDNKESERDTTTAATTTTENAMGEKMKALFYDGPYKVSVKETDLPKIKHPDDVIIKVTTSCICGST